MNERYKKEVFPLLARFLRVDEIGSFSEAFKLIDKTIEETREIALEVLKSQNLSAGTLNISPNLVITMDTPDPNRAKRQEIPAAIDFLVKDVGYLVGLLKKDEERFEVASGEPVAPQILDYIIRKTVENINLLLDKAGRISTDLDKIGWGTTTQEESQELMPED